MADQRVVSLFRYCRSAFHFLHEIGLGCRSGEGWDHVGTLADAELHFTNGVLDCLKLIGFAGWERRSGNRRNVTFPAWQHSVNGDKAQLRCCCGPR
jgi:hypothetical protein